MCRGVPIAGGGTNNRTVCGERCECHARRSRIGMLPLTMETWHANRTVGECHARGGGGGSILDRVLLHRGARAGELRGTLVMLHGGICLAGPYYTT